MILLLNVLRDDFVSDISRTDAEVPARPHVPPPELLSQMRKFMHQLEGTFPFQHLEQTPDCHLRRDTHEQMHMVTRDVPLHNRDFMVATDFADQFSGSQTNFTRHHWLTVLCHPDEVQVNLEGGVRAAPVVLHDGASYTTGAALHTCQSRRLKARVLTLPDDGQ